MHYFSRKQPDLNWENPKLRQEVYGIMRFWLDKGVDGLRMDAFQYVAKDSAFPAFPANYEKQIIKYYSAGPHLHDYLQEMNWEVVLNFTSEKRTWAVPGKMQLNGQPWLNNYPAFAAGQTLTLQPWQAVVVPMR